MRLAAVLFVLAACQSSKEPASKQAPAPATAPAAPAGSGEAYTQDIANLCNAEKLSGALDQPPDGRQIAVAQWLGSNLHTPEAHTFLVHLQPLGATAKGDALDAEAKRVGLAECPLARSWKP